MSDLIPQSLRYSVVKSPSRVQRQRISPLGSNSVGPNQPLHFRLPDKALLCLDTLSLVFDLTISGLDTVTAQYTNVKLPASYKLFKKVETRCGGISASGSMCNQMEQVYHSMVKSTVDNTYLQSRLLNNMLEINHEKDMGATTNAAPATSSKTLSLVYDDFLVMRSKSSTYDASLFGVFEIIFQTAGLEVLQAFAATAQTSLSNISYTLSNVFLDYSVVTQVSPYYVTLLSEKLSSNTKISMPFSNIISTVAANTGSNRLQISSQSLDCLAVVALGSGQATFGPGQNSVYQNPAHFKFDTGLTSATAKNAQIQLQIGSTNYPANPINDALLCAEYTNNSIWGNSVHAKNLLFQSRSYDGNNVTRDNYLSENFIFINKFCLDEPGYQSGIVGGIDCSVPMDIVVNTQGFSNAQWLIFALTTSTLEYVGNGIVQVVQ